MFSCVEKKCEEEEEAKGWEEEEKELGVYRYISSEEVVDVRACVRVV